MGHTEQQRSITELAQAKAAILFQPFWDMRVKATYIDRRQCHRVRPMEVLCLGLERTGTLSLRVALLQLGYYDVYHMSSAMIENPPDGEMWCQAFDAKFFGKGSFGAEEWDQLLGHCMAVSDQPAASFAPELIAAYPEAKIILTVRDSPSDWHRSVLKTTYAISKILSIVVPGNSGSLSDTLKRWFAPRLPFERFFTKLCRVRDYDNVLANAERAYQEHNDLVRRLARERQFLEYNVKDGWEPLCRFLRKEVPPNDRPFPRLNDMAEYERKLKLVRGMLVLGYFGNVLKYLGIVGAVGYAMYLALIKVRYE